MGETSTPTENRPTQIQVVLDKLRTINPEEFQQGLDAKAQETDPAVGIAIVPLSGQGSVITSDGQEYKFYVARVAPGKHVNPHVHFIGEEPYRIVTGEGGIMHIGTVKGQTVTWKSAETKKAGGEIIVQGGEVHSFENIGTTIVDFVFACPDSHLSAKDRIVTTGYQNGSPRYQE